MKILFIEPPFERFIGFRCEWFPMGLVSLATYLEKNGYQARVYNAEHNNSLPYLDIESYAENYFLYRLGREDGKNAVWQEVESIITDYKPDVIGVTIKTVKIPSALKVAKIAKNIYPDVKIVVGGPHPTVCPKEVLASPYIDYVVRGEGEETMAELMRTFSECKDLQSVLGISYKKDGQIYHNNSRPLIQCLETILYPNRELLINCEDYTFNQLAWIMTSRGCPFDCTFCSSKNIWTRTVRYRLLENVIDEVDELKRKYKVTNINFMDDSFTVNRRYVFDLCNTLLERNIKITWSCLTRADLLDDEMVKKIKSAGCTKIDIGIESGSQKVQKIINKGIILDHVKKIAVMLRENKMFWAGFFMIGYPGETKDDVLDTLEFMKEVNPNWVCFSIFTPYPGTVLYEKAVELGLIKKDINYSIYAHQSPNNCFSEKISPEEFKGLAGMMLKEFNSHNASLHSLFRRVLTKNYLENPRMCIHDLRKWLTWILPVKSKTGYYRDN